MAIAVSIDSTYAQNDTTQSTQIVRGTLKFSGNYATHGDTLSFANVYGIQSRSVPLRVFVYEAPAAGTSPSGYVYIFCPGTTNANGKLTVFTTGTASGDALNELAAGAYPAGITGAAVKFEAVFPTFV